MSNTLAGSAVTLADDFSYTDPVDGSNVSARQGIRVFWRTDRASSADSLAPERKARRCACYLEAYKADGALPIALGFWNLCAAPP